MLLLIMLSSRLLTKILSVSEYELFYTLVVLLIVGVKFELCKDRENFGHICKSESEENLSWYHP